MGRYDELKKRLIKKTFSKGELLERATLRSAALIRGFCEERGDSHSRFIDRPIIPDELVIVGISVTRETDRRREHVVPCVKIVRQCHVMIADGATDEEVAAFIRRNLRIVLLGKDECERLDSKAAFNTRTEMPEAWEFGACAFQRLTAAGIEWTANIKDDDLARAMEWRLPVSMANAAPPAPAKSPPAPRP